MGEELGLINNSNINNEIDIIRKDLKFIGNFILLN